MTPFRILFIIHERNMELQHLGAGWTQWPYCHFHFTDQKMDAPERFCDFPWGCTACRAEVGRKNSWLSALGPRPCDLMGLSTRHMVQMTTGAFWAVSTHTLKETWEKHGLDYVLGFALFFQSRMSKIVKYFWLLSPMLFTSSYKLELSF